MKKKSKQDYSNDNPFSLSIGDLMSALLLVFVLLLCGALLRMNEAQNKQEEAQRQLEEIPNSYVNTKVEIYHVLDSVFCEKLNEWGAEIDSTTMSIRFLKESVMFDLDKSDLKPAFQDILAEFYPKYMDVIVRYGEHIEEIRIEGHTSSEGEYFHNMQLSQDRARKVLRFCSSLKNIDNIFLQKKVTANGYSYSRVMTDETGKEDMIRSRRVEFRIITDSENQIHKLIQGINANRK